MRWYHGTSGRAAGAIREVGVDFEVARRSDPGDMGWGFYLTGRRSRARAYGRHVLRVAIARERFAELSNPYFLEGLGAIEPATEIERLFYAVAFDEGGELKTCSGRHDNVRASRAIRDAFVEAGFAGIVTPYQGGEAVVFVPAGIERIDFEGGGVSEAFPPGRRIG